MALFLVIAARGSRGSATGSGLGQKSALLKVDASHGLSLPLKTGARHVPPGSPPIRLQHVAQMWKATMTGSGATRN